MAVYINRVEKQEPNVLGWIYLSFLNRTFTIDEHIYFTEAFEKNLDGNYIRMLLVILK